LVISAQSIRRPNALFSLGATFVLATVFWFSLSPLYSLSLLLLFGTGIAMSGFDATQSTLVLTAAPPEARGTALGVLMLGIGAMPLGMYVLGRLAEQIGPRQSLALMTGIGLLVMGALFKQYPELLDR
jgi:predicted MFS family arabinose efflux permease